MTIRALAVIAATSIAVAGQAEAQVGEPVREERLAATEDGDIVVYGRALPLIGVANSGSEGTVGVLGSRDADITYYYASRLPGEAAQGVDDFHLHPVEPRQVRASIRYSF